MDSGNTNTIDSKKFSVEPPSPNHLPIVRANQDDSVYPMDNPNGRKALIFCHYKYHSSLKLTDRYLGTDIDMRALSDVLPKLGFHDLKIFTDLKLYEIEREIEIVAGDDHVNTDCLAIFVLTHGKRDRLYAYDRDYKLTYLWGEFTGQKGINLTGKPKLFFIQACQGEENDPGQEVQYKSRIQFDGGSPFVTYKLPSQVDFLVAMASIRCSPSRRNKSGSWFIQDMCKIFSDHHETLDLKSMLTIVSREVGKRESNSLRGSPEDHGMKQAPITVSTLLRDLYFKTMLL